MAPVAVADTAAVVGSVGEAESIPAEPTHRRRVDPLLLIALGAALTYHGGLLLAGTYKRTYDAYVHLFFADHYRRGWFSTWDARWYTGFTTVSYPPGAHQSMAFVSRFVSLESAFVVVELGALLLMTLGMYRYSRIWVGERAAVYAAIALVFSTAIAETVHVFGQMPTTIAMGFLLNAAPFVHRWISYGGLRWLVPAVICTAATTAGHHVTTLFGSVFIMGPVIAVAILERLQTPIDIETCTEPVRLSHRNIHQYLARTLLRVLPALIRTGVYGIGVVMSLVIVVLPYWLYSKRDPIAQIPIPHGSRDNFLENLNSGLAFWLIPWGMLLFALPYVLIRSTLDGKWPLAASIALAGFLGTGGTTPFPRMLLGGAFEVLTLDRFTFWAVMLTMPFTGRLIESLIQGRVARTLRQNLGRLLSAVILLTVVLAYLGLSILAANFAQFRPLQPARIDPNPIVSFIDKDQHWRWRYLMLGFGDQMAWVSAQTTAQTVDGNYHSARRLPELVTTPVERLEGAKFRGVPGIGSLQQFLAVPSKYYLKFVFSNDQFYDPLLAFSGWQRIATLENGIVVWEKGDVPPLPGPTPIKEVPGWQRIMWGVLPPAAITSALIALFYELIVRPLRRRRPDKPVKQRIKLPFVGRYRARAVALAQDLVPLESPPRLLVLRRRVKRLGARLVRPVSELRRSVQAGVVVIAMLSGAYVVVGGSTTAVPQPEAPVFAYYDHLDFRRMRAAWEQLDPETRPSLDLFLLQKSVTDGLLASYAKLASIRTSVLVQRGDQATVEATLEFETPLASYVRVRRHDVTRIDGVWYLEPEIFDVSTPPEQFVIRSDLDYLAQGRRRVTTAGTAYDDVLDRPKLRILGAGLVMWNGQPSVIGEVRNDDVEPGDVTITAQLLGADGSPVAEWDASIVTKHQILPGEVVPFRVDFEGVAGALKVDEGTAVFEPGAREPLQLDVGEVIGLDLYAKAVVTGGGLDRPLATEAVTVEQDQDGTWWVSGRLRNDGLSEVTIPHLLFTYRDSLGEVAWVADEFLEDAIRPQRTKPFRVRLDAPADVERRDVTTRTYDNGLPTSRPGPGAPPPTIVLPSATGWASLTIFADGYIRGLAA